MAGPDSIDPKSPGPVAEPLECSLADVRIGRPDTGKTVGDQLRLRCEGNIAEPIGADAEIFFKDDNDKYALHLLEVQKSESAELLALVTSYKPGPYGEQEVFLRSGAKTYQLKGLSWNFETVLPEAEKVQKETLEPPPEQLGPFPFFGPIGVSYPVWIWLAFAVVIVIPAIFIFRLLKKRGQKKSLMAAALSGMGPAGTPLQEFSKIQRQVLRSLDEKDLKVGESLVNLDKGFRNYLVRRCLVPAFDWSETDVIRDIKKYHPKAFASAGSEVLRVLRELNRIKNNEVKRDDLEQLLDQSRRAVEKLEGSL